MNGLRFLLTLLTALTLAAGPARLSGKAPDEFGWPGRFGPTGNSVVPESAASGIPQHWDEQSGKNVLWKIPLPEHGLSTPVILNGRIWLTSATADGHRQYIDCIDAVTGKHLAHQLLFENEDPEPLGNTMNTYASPSCTVTDAAVYAHFGSYGTARIDPNTRKVVWQRRDIHCRHYRGPGSSPVLHDNLLILTFDGIDVQFLMALDTDTGRTVWRTDRSTDYGDLDENGRPIRDGDLRKAFSTPGLIRSGNRTLVVSVGARAAFAYDAETGEEVWTVRHDAYNAVAPPIFCHHPERDLAILHTGATRGSLLAVSLDTQARGNITDSHIVWTRQRGNARLAAPVLYDGRVFMVTGQGVAVCVDAVTGKELNKIRLGGSFVASPVVIGRVIYAADEDGTVVLFRADPSMEIIRRNRLSEGMRASPAVAGGRLYLRTLRHLYCLSEQRTP